MSLTHKLEEIKKVADCCAILCKGKLIDVLDVATTSTREMANKMVGREVNFRIEKKQPHFGKEVLSVQNITIKDENGYEVVKNATFSICRGEVLAFAGVSGNGQVELADAIAGLLPVYSGKIFLNGQDITNAGIRKRIDDGIAYIPEDRQKYGLILDFSLRDNFALKNYYKEPFSKKGILNQNEFEDFGEKLIERYDIRSGQGNKGITRSMSGGNQQKALIAREIEQDASLVIFAALAVAVALRAGLFNIGISGQMLAAGFFASVIVGYSTLAAPIAKVLVILICFAVGALVVGLIGFLKHKFNINEVVSSIMLNYIVEYVTSFFIYMKYVEPVSRQSKNISDAARLTLKNLPLGSVKADIPLGIIPAIMVAFLIKYMFDRTTFGYEIKAIGFNGNASKLAQMPSSYSDLVLVLPYVVTLLLLIFFSKHNVAPRALGEIYDKGKR